MGERAEGTPMILARGLSSSAPEVDNQNLISPLEEKMFQWERLARHCLDLTQTLRQR